MLKCACGNTSEQDFIAVRGQCSACEDQQNRLIFSASCVVFGIIFAGLLLILAWKVG
jgi:hypothetical protein